MPPIVPLAFRVGVIGHRPDRLGPGRQAGVAAALRTVLADIKSTVDAFDHPGLFSSGRPVLRAITPLAEGTDRIFAEQALGLGYELTVPTPFAVGEFEQDFREGKALEPDSLTRFRRLRERATVTFELAGDRASEARAYAAAGRIVLGQSDVLVVVWDGWQTGKRGGTEQTLIEARSYGVPVVWVDAEPPHAWVVLAAADDLEAPIPDVRVPLPQRSTSPVQALHDTVTRLIEPPLVSKDIVDLRPQFFAETKPAWNLAFVWKLFRNLVGSNELEIQKFRVDDFEESVAKDWPTNAPGVVGWVNRHLRPHYAWPDKLADYYADRYRSAFLLAYGLAALAVFLALFPLAAGLHHPVGWIVAELLTLLAIVGLIQGGRKLHWHDRWMEYRLLAELIRELRLLVPLGGGQPSPRQPAHLAALFDPAGTWVFWHMRSIARFVGLPPARLTLPYLEDCMRHLERVLEEQDGFHDRTNERFERIEHRLHGLGAVCLGGTIVAVSLHLVPLLAPLGLQLTFFCAFLPALGAAAAGVLNQGEFARIKRRSRAMLERIRKLRLDLGQLEATAGASSPARSTDAMTRLTSGAAQLMVDEVLDWRLVFLDRPLVPPS